MQRGRRIFNWNLILITWQLCLRCSDRVVVSPSSLSETKIWKRRMQTKFEVTLEKCNFVKIYSLQLNVLRIQEKDFWYVIRFLLISIRTCNTKDKLEFYGRITRQNTIDTIEYDVCPLLSSQNNDSLGMGPFLSFRSISLILVLGNTKAKQLK